MKTKLTKQMEQALVADALKKGKHPALEVLYWHTELIGKHIYRPVGQAEYIDAVIEEDGMFSCLELKVSMTDLHSKAAQSFVGNKNYLVCPLKMAKEIKERNDSWIKSHPAVGIIGWDEKETFKVVKHCQINYSLPRNDWMTLAKGMISSLSGEMKKERRDFYGTSI